MALQENVSHVSKEKAARPGAKNNHAGIYDAGDRYIDLNRQLIQNKSATFLLKVNCDAMREAGIHKGDIAVVDRSIQASNGRVIIAMLNGEMLIRRFERINNRIRLLADSSKLSPIPIEPYHSGFAVWGVVTYVIHAP